MFVFFLGGGSIRVYSERDRKGNLGWGGGVLRVTLNPKP